MMLVRFFERIGAALLCISSAALAVIALAFSWEVFVRAVFNAPTTWTADAVQYALPLVIFLALPEATLRRAHFSIDLLAEILPKRAAAALININGLIASLACLAAGGLCTYLSHSQFLRGTMTNAINPIPRWWLTSVLAVGFLLAAVQMLRIALERRK